MYRKPSPANKRAAGNGHPHLPDISMKLSKYNLAINNHKDYVYRLHLAFFSQIYTVSPLAQCIPDIYPVKKRAIAPGNDPDSR